MKRSHKKVKSMLCQGAFGKEWLTIMNSVCIKGFSWAARWSVAVGYLPGRTWKAFSTVSTGLLSSSKLANTGRLSLNNVGIQNCWRLFAFWLFHSSRNYPSYLKRHMHHRTPLSLFKALSNPKAGWNNPLGQRPFSFFFFYMGFHKWAFRGSWTPANICGIWCIIMCIYSLLFRWSGRVTHLLLDF